MQRGTATDIKTILVNFGATDAGNMTLRSIQAIRQTSFGGKIVAVVGSLAPNLAEIIKRSGQDGNVELHIDVDNMAELMSAADLSIGAPGSTTWERCCLGLPSVIISIANNQREIARQMASNSAAITLNSVSELPSAIQSILENPMILARLSAAAAPLTDGVGVKRIASHILGVQKNPTTKDISVRTALVADAMDLWLWRNDPLARLMAKMQHPIIWQEHQKWYDEILASANHRIFIVEAHQESIGMVRFDNVDDGILLSINLNPVFHGCKLGYAALKAGIEAFASMRAERPLFADIHYDNLPSLRIFEQCGFCKIAENEFGFSRFLQS